MRPKDMVDFQVTERNGLYLRDYPQERGKSLEEPLQERRTTHLRKGTAPKKKICGSGCALVEREPREKKLHPV